MNSDRTELQTASAQSISQELSMRATTPPADVPGYRLNQFLGSGAFGQVWVGRDLNTGRDVAVKFYLHRGGVNWSLLSREVKNLVQLSADRYVVQVLEVGWDADPPYYVMELITGGSLEELLRSGKTLPVDQAIEIFRKICIGLNRCHAKGVLHCDIKPANILLDHENEPRLADFGQSRLSSDQTPALGTLFYMAPEQADLNSTPDASWDVYAVGAIMYRMLIGSPPYRDDQIVEQLDTAGSLPKRLEKYRAAIAAQPVPDAHFSMPSVDRSLARIISKCLAVNPEDRYANVQQILDDLNRRDDTRARQPLMLLGIVGPLLVLMATSFFGVRSIREAHNRTMEALRKEAYSSNKLAATYAASTLESEIDDYFEIAREEASRDAFVTQLKKTLADSQVRESLDQIAGMKTPDVTHHSTDARKRLLQAPTQIELEDLLAQRLSQYTSQDPYSRKRRLATMFVTDPMGTIISVAYSEKVASTENSAGKNFCYRTYYHGGAFDLPKDSTQIGQIEPLRSTHLSSAFPSTATRLWKVAVSTPIYLSDDHSKPDALFVVTINLGDFQLKQGEEFQGEGDQKPGNQVTVLVEAREGPVQGTVLQHPLMDRRRHASVGAENKQFQIKRPLMQLLLEKNDVNYEDPLASARDGQMYAGPWIAAIQPVSLPHDDTNADDPLTQSAKTDLLVLVQYRLKAVNEPVEQLRTALMMEGAAAIASILVVTLTCWLFVRRVDKAGAELDQNEEPKHQANIDTLSVR